MKTNNNATHLADVSNNGNVEQEKTFKSKYEYPVYIIDEGLIKTIKMKEYLETYWNDETTTPEGICNRTQVRAILVGRKGELLDYRRYEEDLYPEYYKDEDDGWIPAIKYGTFTWRGANGNHPFKWNGDQYDSFDEAYESILDDFYHDFQIHSSSAPIPYQTFEEAKEGLKEELFFKKYGYYPSQSALDILTLEDILNDEKE